VDLPALLRPYIENLSSAQLDQISTYIEILLRWNAKMNLTAIRKPEQIATRHFGESLYLAHKLSEAGLLRSADREAGGPKIVVDVGSGAGFPGIPLKIACPDITLTLIEAQQRKAVFLKEVLRSLHLEGEVNNIRAEEFARLNPKFADLVTLRAVEKFEAIIPVAARLANADGTLAVLVGGAQVGPAKDLLKQWQFGPLLPIPSSENRVILLANQGS
jgi:16S rRNA (guanine527-N7)-methyltransferase